ncbi:hypothetical protein [Mucilaginibacter sp. FT3.2]|uniref:hypothetical protein n=1 Tax=Mucilaginibacter sp. FT3.2 TaxID=2723090 RepID=UPI00161F1B55|nr:hypothetical protein [Mucilaginibacter sp. FT3.2]MBB6232376.1 hypothetical protein [Mucilaginibacter sp. FT3.2]
MEWYQYLSAFFAGAFFANTIPHFVHGISGNKFPTPFAKPPGVGLSSSTINVIWALFNLVVTYLLFMASKLDNAHPLLLLVFFAGIAAMAIMLSIRFKSKHTA